VQIDVAILSTRSTTTYVVKHDAETYSDTPHRMLQLPAKLVAKLTASIGWNRRRQCRPIEAHSLQASADLPNLCISLWSEVRRQDLRDTPFATPSNSTIAPGVVPCYVCANIYTYRTKHVPNFMGLSPQKAWNIGTVAAGFGVSAGIFALFFFGEVPKVRNDILSKAPLFGDYFVREIPPEDNPF